MNKRITPALRPRWRHALWGALLGLLVAICVWAPARWLAWGVAQASQGRVQLLQPRNSLWAGSAQLMLSGGAGSRDAQALPGRLRWRIEPGWTGLRVLWRAECCMAQPASVSLQLGLSTLQLNISDHLSQWPAALLSGLGAPWNTLQPEGQLQWRSEGLQLSPRLQGSPPLRRSLSVTGPSGVWS
jgi:general secretion pathway protein N